MCVCVEIQTSITTGNEQRGRETDASALSKLSLNTLVTARSMSKLSVASVRIFCAAFVAAPAVGKDATPLAVLVGP